MKRIGLIGLFLAISALSKPAQASGPDLSKSITIGNGPKMVIEFTDPECPYCRKASKFFEGRSDVTRHIFFYPLPYHPRAKEKAQYVLSQQDKAKAYHMIMSGSLDRRPRLEATPKGIRLQEEQLDIAKKEGVDSTPTFQINGRIIEGFDQRKIEEALGK